MDQPIYVVASLSASVATSVYAFSVISEQYNDHVAQGREADLVELISMFVLNQRICVVVALNLVYCLLFLLGKLIIFSVFDQLRNVEKQLMYDRLLNYLVMKTVFVGAILEPKMEELLIWTSWFTAIGYLRIFSMLCRDRFESLTLSPSASVKAHLKIVVLLSGIVVVNILMCLFGIQSFPVGWILLSLFLFECFTLFMDTVQTLIKYGIHLTDLMSNTVWESRAILIYYTEFVTEILIQLSTFCYYVLILFLHGLSFSLIDAVLILHIRAAVSAAYKKIQQFKEFRTALQYMRTRYADATSQEIKDFNDNCAICRETMDAAKKLPCGHLFHLQCLRSWVAHHSSCPTCRRSLSPEALAPAPAQGQPIRHPQEPQAPPQQAPVGGNNAEIPPLLNEQRIGGQRRRVLFQADRLRHRGPMWPAPGSGWMEWFPELQDAAVGADPRLQEAEPERLGDMVQQVLAVFPEVGSDLVRQDILRTHSVAFTINNIMDGRIH